MSSVVEAVGRGDSSADRALVGAVDLVVIVTLLLVGQVSHGLTPIADPIGSAETVAPFVLGWLVTAALGDPYATGAFASVGRAVRTTALHWLAAANVGLVLRASPAFDGGVEWAFPLVITGLGLVALVGWRVAFVAIRSQLAATR